METLPPFYLLYDPWTHTSMPITSTPLFNFSPLLDHLSYNLNVSWDALQNTPIGEHTLGFKENPNKSFKSPTRGLDMGFMLITYVNKAIHMP